MYLVLNGVEPSKITILTATRAQERLIKEVLEKKTSWHSRFGLPRTIGYIVDVQSHSNDYVIASFVRSSSPGLASHPDWLATLLGQAKLGLFVLCNADLFSQVEPVQKLLQIAGNRNHKLELNCQGHQKAVDSYQDLYKVVQDLFSKPRGSIN